MTPTYRTCRPLTVFILLLAALVPRPAQAQGTPTLSVPAKAADSARVTVTMAGRVTLGSGTLGRRRLIVYVENARGGVRVYNRAGGPRLTLGDSVEVRGVLDNHLGMPVLSDAEVRVLPVPRVPLAARYSDLNDLSRRLGTLVTLDVVVTRAWSQVGHPQLTIEQDRRDAAMTTTATDTSSPKVILFEDANGALPADLSTLREGDRLRATGVVTLRTVEGEPHYAVVPRLASDVKSVGITKHQLRSVVWVVVVALCLVLLVAVWIGSLRSEVARRARALESSESRYKRIFAESPAGNFVSTPDGRLLACNANFARIFGFASTEEGCATPAYSAYLDPRDRDEMVKELRRAGRLVGRELKLRRVDGSVVEVQENVVGHFNDKGELTELHGFILDLTEQRRLESEFRQAQKTEAIGRLAGGVAHDFNNLLTVILASSELALEALEPGDKVRADIEGVRNAARRGVALTAHLLSFSRRQVLQEAVVDVSTIVDGLGSMVRRLVGAAVSIDVVLPVRPQQPVLVDPHQLEQAVLNLAVNASDAMPSGGVLQFSVDEVTLDDAWVAANAGARAGQFCRIQIRDSGCGMDSVTRTRAFEPFFSTKPLGQGTGLGLSMVFGFIKQSGGYVTIDSALHQGTTVSLYLPVTHAELPPPPNARTIAAGAGTEQRGSGTVLIVEDEDLVRAVAARVIAGLGFDTLVAANAREAAALALTVDSLALVLTDVVMPNGGGLEVATEMRVQFPGVPVIYMSGYMEDEKVLRSLRSPEHGFIGKPFTPASLTAKVLANAHSVDAAPERDHHYSHV